MKELSLVVPVIYHRNSVLVIRSSLDLFEIIPGEGETRKEVVLRGLEQKIIRVDPEKPNFENPESTGIWTSNRPSLVEIEEPYVGYDSIFRTYFTISPVGGRCEDLKSKKSHQELIWKPWGQVIHRAGGSKFDGLSKVFSYLVMEGKVPRI